MKAMYRAFASRRAYERAQRAARLGARPFARNGRIDRLPWPLAGWSATRELAEPPKETFRDWWRRERGDRSGPAVGSDLRSGELFPRTSDASHPGATEPGDARRTILGRVRSALAGGSGPTEVPRDYRRRSERSREEIVALFVERVGEYRASVRRARSGEVPGLLAELCRERGARRMVAPTGLPEGWRPLEIELVADDGLSPHDLDALDGAITGCALAIAETGVIVLDGGAGQGRRALTLVPDYHLCLVREEQIYDLVTEAVEALEPAVREGRPLTFVAGPSATSDIELNRVEGVHGPRTLHVVVLSG
jgi:L-lactate dehydrogenase complex protein LldG